MRTLRGGLAWVESYAGPRPMEVGECVGYATLIPKAGYDTVANGRADAIEIAPDEVIQLVSAGNATAFAEYTVFEAGE